MSATWNTAGRADLVRRWCMPKPQSRRNYIGKVLRVSICCVHNTAGKLSQPIVVWAPTIATGLRAASRTVSCSSTPAISRSELVRCPSGLVVDTTASVTSLGNWTRHTMGSRRCIQPNHPPQAPKALVLQYPM
jgi:hypothetical protein